jgi:hypothetical protein
MCRGDDETVRGAFDYKATALTSFTTDVFAVSMSIIKKFSTEGQT